MFTASGGSEGGANKSQLISLAMSEASKLFDSAGGSASGNKQDAVNGAAMTVMKLLVQSKFTNAIGGENSGGISGLVGMVYHFFTMYCLHSSLKLVNHFSRRRNSFEVLLCPKEETFS